MAKTSLRDRRDLVVTPTPRPAWQRLPQLLLSRRWRWGTLVVLAAVAVFLRLGFWQLDRLSQRREHNALLAARLDAPPLTLQGQPIDLEQEAYRRVTLSGSFDDSQSIVIRNRTRQGAPGLDLVVPFHIAGTGASVLVDRGWIPFVQADPSVRGQFAAPDVTTLTGILRPPQSAPSRFAAPDRLPPAGRLDAWFRVDIPRIAPQLPYPVEPYFVDQLPVSGAPDLPFPQPATDFLNEGPHLGYAVQWFAFAVIVLVGHVALILNRIAPVVRPPFGDQPS
ncbi:MAG: SURF1 family protein [Herpetosiphon sp.]